jgi:hypothetical protein
MLNSLRQTISGHHFFIFVFLSSCMIMSACNNSSTIPTLTPIPQSAQQIMLDLTTPANSAPAPQPDPTATSTPLPSPSETSYNPQPTEDEPTLDPQGLLTEQASERERTQIAGFSPECNELTHKTSLSPKGNWLAVSCGYSHDQTLQIYGNNGKKWVLPLKNYLAKQDLSDGEAPMGSLEPIHWTGDENYLYFTSYIGYDGGGTCLYGFGDQGLFRFNTNSGEVSATLPLVSGAHGYIISFPPQGRWFAYTRRTPGGTPEVQDLQSGEEIPLQNDQSATGDFIWSPDGANLVYAFCQPSDNYSTVKRSGIRLFSLQTRQTKTVFEVDGKFVYIESRDGKQLKVYMDDAAEPNLMDIDWANARLVTPAAVQN